MADGADGAGFILNNETRYAIFDRFRDGAAIERDKRRAASHGFDHDQSERLRPVDRHDQRDGVAQELRLLRVRDLADEFDMRFGEKRLNHFLEIVVIGRVDFRCDLKRQATSFGDVDRAINPLLRRNATQKGEIGRVRRRGLEEAGGHPVMNSTDPMRVGRGPPLQI